MDRRGTNRDCKDIISLASQSGLRESPSKRFTEKTTNLSEAHLQSKRSRDEALKPHSIPGAVGPRKGSHHQREKAPPDYCPKPCSSFPCSACCELSNLKGLSGIRPKPLDVQGSRQEHLTCQLSLWKLACLVGRVRLRTPVRPLMGGFPLRRSKLNEPLSKLLVSLITPIVVPYITPFKEFRLIAQMEPD